MNIEYVKTLDEECETDRDIINLINRWEPTFEKAGLSREDLVWAMLHFSATESVFLDYLGGFLEEANADPTWKFNPWTGEAIATEAEPPTPPQTPP